MIGHVSAGGGGVASLETFWSLRSSNYWKYNQIIVNPTIWEIFCVAFEESFLFVTGSLQYFVSCMYKQVIKQSHSLLSCDTKGMRELQSCHLLQGHTCTCNQVFWTLLQFWWSQFLSSEAPCFLFPTWTWVLNTRKDFCKTKPASMFFHFENCQTHVEQFTHLFDWQVVWIFKKDETVSVLKRLWTGSFLSVSLFPLCLALTPSNREPVHRPTDTMLFCIIIFESFMIQLGRPFWLQGGCMCTPYTPLPSRAC